MWLRKAEAQNNPITVLLDVSFDKSNTHNTKHHQRSLFQKLSNTNRLKVEQNNEIILQQLRV